MKTTFYQAHRELLASLGTLRMLVKEVGGNYLAGLQSEAARIQQTVRLVSESDMPSRKQLEQMRSMLKAIQGLDVKPPKGRRRDLKELDKTILKLGDMVDHW